MKKLNMVFLVFAVILTFSACACSHEWTEADCLIPKTCTKCGAVEGETSGHDWQEATCTAPKTCTKCGAVEGEALEHDWQEASCAAPETCPRCGSTRGDVLPHTLGDWVFSGEEMSRECSGCGFVEASEIDREAYFWEMIVDRWDFSHKAIRISENDEMVLDAFDMYDALSGRMHGQYMIIGEDGALSYFDGTATVDGVLSFDHYQGDSDAGAYHGFLTLEDGRVYSVMLLDAEEDLLHVYLSDTEYIVLGGNRQIEASIVGTWLWDEHGSTWTYDGYEPKNEIRFLTFNADRTFSGYHRDSEVSGSWYISSACEQSGYYASQLILNYTKEGMEYSDHVGIDFYNMEANTMKRVLQHRAYTMYFAYPYDAEKGWKYDHYYYWHQDPDTIGKMTGSWVNTGNTELATVTLKEDGTFSLDLPEPVSGCWYAYGDTITIESDIYGLKLVYEKDGTRFVEDGNVDFHPEGGFQDLRAFQNVYELKTEDEIARLKAMNEKLNTVILGTWSFDSFGRYDYEFVDEPFTVLDSNCESITFLEDGTFSMVGENKSGTWTAKRSHTEGGNEFYHYDLVFDNGQTGGAAYFASDGRLFVDEEYDAHYYSYEFCSPDSMN